MSLVLLNIAVAGFFFWIRFGARSRLRKLYDKQRRNFPGTMTLIPAGLHFESIDGTTKADYMWNAFESFIERTEMFIVLPNTVSFLRIPKDKLTVAEQDEVRGWLSAVSKLIG